MKSFIGLTAWRDSKISNLENTIESYRERNKQLESELVELNELRLKCKIQQMLIDDDAAIEELLECNKTQMSAESRVAAWSQSIMNDQLRMMNEQRRHSFGQLGQANMGALL